MRAEKQLLLEEITDKIKDSKGFIVANYQQFTAARSRDFRNMLSEVGGEFEVVRKRVFVKAVESLGLKFELARLQGHVGLIFVNTDAMVLAKKAVQYGEDNENIISVLGGQIEGQQCSAEDVVALAKLPPLPQMRAQLLGLFEAPMSQTLSVMQSALTSVLYCLDEKGKKE